MTEKLSVCFLWHMHQPLYKDRVSGRYLMPWVRLHAIKDYADMALLLEDFPGVHQTFNLVPSLVEQLNDYGDHGAVDDQLLWTIKDESTYTHKEKTLILSESFHCNMERQITPHRPYLDLFRKREQLWKKGRNFDQMHDFFTPQEFADMATWFNLAWFDPIWIERYPEIAQLIHQGKNFTLDQRCRVIEVEREIIRQTIPIYKSLLEKGQIELTTTPYYHPILPLLIDSNTARLANPYCSLPERGFLQRNDAIAQIRKGIDFHKATFGKAPGGMWPSEMAASPAALELISEAGINWVVLDEGILNRSRDAVLFRDEFGNLNNPEVICQPYRLVVGDQEITILFREVVTSNEIGFTYCKREPAEAAQALYMRLKHIQQRLFDWPREGVVVIALDGENCWETYEQDGNPFLIEFYKRISVDNTLNICTVSDYLERHPATEELYNLHCGSWINSDFHIWIGDPVKNKAWDLLGQTRHFLQNELQRHDYPEEIRRQCWEEIYAAEGSDWFWWFGEPNNSAQDHMFDEQFRIRLQNVYQLLGKSYPETLGKSVYEQVEHVTPQPAVTGAS